MTSTKRIERSRRPHLIQAIVYVSEANVGTNGSVGVTFGTPHGVLIITKMDDTSPFQHCDMQVGDRVYKINNERCYSSPASMNPTPEWAVEQLWNTKDNVPDGSPLVMSIAVLAAEGDTDLVSTTIVNPPPRVGPSPTESWLGIGFKVNVAICRLVVGALDKSVDAAYVLPKYSCLWEGDECVSINGCDCRVSTASLAVTTMDTTNQGGFGKRVVTLVTKPSATNEDAVEIRRINRASPSSCCCYNPCLLASYCLSPFSGCNL